MNKYLVLNETTFAHTSNVVTEVVSLHASLQGALDFLAELAQDNGVTVEPDANSVYLPVTEGYIEADEYYIIEMEEEA